MHVLGFVLRGHEGSGIDDGTDADVFFRSMFCSHGLDSISGVTQQFCLQDIKTFATGEDQDHPKEECCFLKPPLWTCNIPFWTFKRLTSNFQKMNLFRLEKYQAWIRCGQLFFSILLMVQK